MLTLAHDLLRLVREVVVRSACCLTAASPSMARAGDWASPAAGMWLYLDQGGPSCGGV